MIARKLVPQGVLRSPVLVCIFLPPSWRCVVLSGVLRWSVAMLGWIAVVLLCRSLVRFKRVSVLSSGVRFWLPGHVGIDNLNVVRTLGRLLDRGCLSKPVPLVKDGDLIAIVRHMILAGVQTW